jgi:uncharacterized protein (DUF697 family)
MNGRLCYCAALPLNRYCAALPLNRYCAALPLNRAPRAKTPASNQARATKLLQEHSSRNTPSKILLKNGEGYMTKTVSKVEETTQTARDRERVEQARAIVRPNVLWAMGAGVIPFPIVDVLGITAVQLKMLKQLGDHYNVPFIEHRAKSIIGALVGGLGTVGAASLTMMSVVKVLPFAGQTLGAVAVPIAGGAITHALGQVFIQHFESDGTFLDFDPVGMRDHFRREFETAKDKVKTPTYQSESSKSASAVG